jgi:AraC-like DNA-binding protein
LLELWRSKGVQVVISRWSPGRHPVRCTAQTQYAILELMMYGSFLKRSSAGVAFGDPNTVVLFNPGEQFDIDHPVLQENTAVTIRIDAGAMERWLPLADRFRVNDLSRPFGACDAPTPPNAQLAAHSLVKRMMRQTHGDAFEIEECLVGLIGELLEAHRLDHRHNVVDQDSPHSCDHVVTAKEYLNEAFASPVRLDDVAAAAGCSSWHLSRVFAQNTGLRMFAYLRRLRIRHALAALADGCEDITRLALQAGFCSHSHFTAAFRSEFGVPPRDARLLLCKCSADE